MSPVMRSPRLGQAAPCSALKHGVRSSLWCSAQLRVERNVAYARPTPALQGGRAPARLGDPAPSQPQVAALVQQQQQTQAHTQQQQQQGCNLTQLVAQPSTLAAATLGFALAATDVFGSSALHVLPQLDEAVHQAVLAATHAEWRATTADIDVSDAFITLGIAGWLLTTPLAAAASPTRAAAPLAACWGLYMFGFGAVFTDPWVVAQLKHAFHRARPSDLHHSFSFPSGHTTAAVFITGAFLAVLLPLAVQLAQQRLPPQHQRHPLLAPLMRGVQSPSWNAAALCVWGVAGATTAAGRVLADAHWLSDVLAGGCLGVAAVSILAQLVGALPSNGGAEEGSIDSSA